MISYITLRQTGGEDEVVIKEGTEERIFKRLLAADFAAQRNFALTKAKGDWIFFIDSDEKLSGEIIEIPQGFDAFFLKRIDKFFGKILRHGETANIKLLRFAKKEFGTWHGKVHEVWEGKGKIGELKIYIEHTPHPTIKEFISEINTYTSIRAKELENFRYSELLKPPFKFLDNYFLKLGFLDGIAGFAMAFMMSLHSLIVRVKNYENQTS